MTPAPHNYGDLVAEAKATISEVTVHDAFARASNGAVLLDVREPGEVAAGTAVGAVVIPRGVLEGSIATAVPDTNTEIAIYCATGARSALAAQTLLTMGYQTVHSVAGGFEAWKSADLPWQVPAGLSDAQAARYQRHLSLPEIGLAGQQRLLDSRVLVIGAGGLGSPALMYLAAAGVGTVVVADNDVVDASNLQRQIIHTEGRIGVPKVVSAQQTIAGINPDVRVEPHRVRVTSETIETLFDGVDVVIDGADNFPTRYLVNDASIRTGIPVVHGSIFRFEGQVSVFDPRRGPCYRCLFPMPPPPELAPNCAEAGVLGVLPGVIGTLQATEAIKLLLGIGEPLIGSLLTYDALDQRVMRLNVAKREDCAACGSGEPPPLVDYDELCIPVS